MSARSKARRERASAPPPAAPPVGSGTPGTPPPPGAPKPPGRRLNLPRLPLLAAILGIVLLAAAWTTRWTPGEPRAEDQAARFTIDIPADRQRVINNWERFFICYDLAGDPRIVDLTLRANQRATGTLDFPVEKVIVELPAANASAEPLSSGGEEDLIAVKNAVLGAAVPERMAAIRQQCAA